MKNDIIYSSDCAEDSQLMARLKQVINDWANSIPHHSYQNLGEKITINSLHYTPAYPVTLNTQYEQRKKSEAHMPYDKREIAERTLRELSDLDVWQTPLNKVNAFTSSTTNFIARGSEHIADCHTCNAQGWITCTQCGGEKKVTCTTCHGQGKTTCHSCSGSGNIKCSRCNGRGFTLQEVKCPTCNGTGLLLNEGTYNTDRTTRYYNCPECHGGTNNKNVTCNDCGGKGKTHCSTCHGTGKVTCNHCHGKGIIICPQCSGSGKNTCPTCHGQQQLMHYYNIQRTLTAHAQTTCALHSTTHAKFPEFQENWPHYAAQSIFHIKKDKIGSDDLPTAPHLTKLFSSLIQEAEKRCHKGELILFQDLDIKKIDVWTLDYTFEGKKFTFTFYGHKLTLIPGTNPISLFSTALTQKAKQAANKRAYVKAYKLVKKSQDLKTYGQQNDIKKILLLLQEKIGASYHLGAKTVTLISALLIGFMAYSYYNNINYVFSWASYLNKPTNFLYAVHPWAMTFFTTWSCFALRKKAGTLAYKIFGPISSGAFRFLAGAIIATLITLLVFALIALINTTGITTLLTFAGWLVYWIFKILLLIVGLIIGAIIWVAGKIF